MIPRRPIVLASFLGPALQAHGEVPPQSYDLSYQFYQEGDGRIEVEATYLRGEIELNDTTGFRFQLLNDAISGASPTGALPGGSQPFVADVEDVRQGILGALSRRFGDHRVELEVARSKEDDYGSTGIALTDTWELNQKNTTLTVGFNYLDDSVKVAGLSDQDKNAWDLFTGVTQIIDRNTVVSANLTLGYAEGYLNDPYKVVQRNEVAIVPDGLGGTVEVPVVNIYPENRPDSRFRQVLQLEGLHYFESANGALDLVLRLSNDDFGIFSQMLNVEWRQSIGEDFQVVPFFRFYHQNAADFFVNTLDGLPVATPSPAPDGGGPNYSADYRLSSFDALSGGLKLSWRINGNFEIAAAYERYMMEGSGSDASPDQSYPTADIWTFGVSAVF